MMYLHDLIPKLIEGKVAMADFGGDRWHITNSVGFIRYCDLNGRNIGEIVKLTRSNILASYILIDDMSWIK